jgi:hypothetical protein
MIVATLLLDLENDTTKTKVLTLLERMLMIFIMLVNYDFPNVTLFLFFYKQNIFFIKTQNLPFPPSL